MEFKFNVDDIFKQPVVVVNHNLIPPGFSGDRRHLWDTVSKMQEVVNAMGEASAKAQGLTKPITTADRLRNSEHRLLLLVDHEANNGKGAVTGMLKVGNKTLYMFDRDGEHYQVTPLCVLDFYVHESRQRLGLGKILFEHMLELENTKPEKIAIDRPSDKFLGFLKKHYNLDTPIKQMNNYVVFNGFFDHDKDETNGKSVRLENHTSANSSPFEGFPAYGRYGAPRTLCSMGQVIHNQSSTVQDSPKTSGNTIKKIVDENNDISTSANASPKIERPQTLAVTKPELEDEKEEEMEELLGMTNGLHVEDEVHNNQVTNSVIKNNIIHAEEAVASERKTPSHLTEQGFFDLKFYHSKLW